MLWDPKSMWQLSSPDQVQAGPPLAAGQWSLVLLGKLDAPPLPTAAVMGWCPAAPRRAES